MEQSLNQAEVPLRRHSAVTVPKEFQFRAQIIAPMLRRHKLRLAEDSWANTLIATLSPFLFLIQLYILSYEHFLNTLLFPRLISPSFFAPVNTMSYHPPDYFAPHTYSSFIIPAPNPLRFFFFSFSSFFACFHVASTAYTSGFLPNLLACRFLTALVQ